MYVVKIILIQIYALLFQSGLYFLDVQMPGLKSCLCGKPCGSACGFAEGNAVGYPVCSFISCLIGGEAATGCEKAVKFFRD